MIGCQFSVYCLIMTILLNCYFLNLFGRFQMTGQHHRLSSRYIFLVPVQKSTCKLVPSFSIVSHSFPWWSVNDFLRQGLGNIPLQPQKTLENSFEFFCSCSTCNEVKKNRRVSRKCQTNSTTLLLLLLPAEKNYNFYAWEKVFVS